MARFYIIAAGALALVSLVGYGVSLHIDSKMLKSNNEIVKLAHEKKVLEVEIVEDEAKRTFKKVEQKIKIDSNKTRAYTNNMMEDDDVKDFNDSF